MQNRFSDSGKNDSSQFRVIRGFHAISGDTNNNGEMNKCWWTRTCGGQTKRANERSFVYRPPAWRTRKCTGLATVRSIRNMHDEDVTEAVVAAIHNRRQRVLAAALVACVALAVLPREASAEGARKFRVSPTTPPFSARLRSSSVKNLLTLNTNPPGYAGFKKISD